VFTVEAELTEEPKELFVGLIYSGRGFLLQVAAAIGDRGGQG
jgi:hypothetical protein